MSRDKQNIKTTDWLIRGIPEEQLKREKREAIKEAEAELRDKQIEEMAKDFCALNMPCEECHLYNNRCRAKKYATRAYNAGYRKASDVAEEIFAEIDKLLAVDRNGEANLDVRALQRLKKKYTEGKDV
jgi:hypothetical protein